MKTLDDLEKKVEKIIDKELCGDCKFKKFFDENYFDGKTKNTLEKILTSLENKEEKKNE